MGSIYSSESARKGTHRWNESSLILTRAGGLQPLLEFLGAIGTPIPRMLRSARIPTGLLEDPEALVPLHLVHRLIEACVSSQGIEDLGAVVASRTSAFDLAVLGPELRRAVTIYEYLQTGNQVIGAVTGGERFWLTLEQDQVRVHHFAPGKTCEGRCQEDVYSLVVTIGMIRRFIGQDWSPDHVDLLTTNDRLLGDREIFGDAQLRLGQSHSSFTLPFSLLQRPIPANPGRVPASDSEPQRVEPTMPERFLESVETLVRSLLAAGSPTMELCAEAAGMSTRTLQRRLSDCGRSYSDIVAHSRIELASDWLIRADTPVCEISAALGYTDPANFCRAFRRTTGISPTQYRARYC